jgi:hypothetical protein
MGGRRRDHKIISDLQVRLRGSEGRPNKFNLEFVNRMTYKNTVNPRYNGPGHNGFLI